MDKQEKIVCAAVRFTIPKGDYTGVKIVTGVSYKSIVEGGILDYLAHEETNIWQKGFVTNHNRFVDAKEAYRIALHANQIKPMMILTDPPQYPDLKPEDLY